MTITSLGASIEHGQA